MLPEDDQMGALALFRTTIEAVRINQKVCSDSGYFRYGASGKMMNE